MSAQDAPVVLFSNHPTHSHPMRVVIIGSAGRLGSALAESYSRDVDVIAFGRNELDLIHPDSIRRALEPLEYDRLILPGALTLVDYCETHEEEAFAANAEGPRLIAEISARKGAHVTYVSTDFVFDGSSPVPYDEEQPARPLSVYGASKKKGEDLVLGVSDRNLVVRVSWLYSGGKPAFPEWIINQAKEHETLALPGAKIGSTNRAGDVVDYLRPLLGLAGGSPANGIFHLANSGQCSWQEWGQFCIDEALARGLVLRGHKVEANRLEDIKAFVAPRPLNSVLDTGKFTALTGITPRPWQEAMKEHFSTSPLFRREESLV